MYYEVGPENIKCTENRKAIIISQAAEFMAEAGI